MDAGLLHCLHLLIRRAFSARDYRARVPHAPALRGCYARDVAHDRLFYVLPYEVRGILLGASAYLAYHDNRLG